MTYLTQKYLLTNTLHLSTLGDSSDTAVTKFLKARVNQMFEIHDMGLFDQTVEQAVADAFRNVRKEWRRNAWVSSIVQAAGFLKSADLDALDYSRGRLVFTNSVDHGFTVTAESCECTDAIAGRPCRHRAMVRLLSRYYERLGTLDVTLPQGYRSEETLECGKCSWRGLEREVIYNTTSPEYPTLCPKCESADLDAVPTTYHAGEIRRVYAYAAAAGGSR